MRDLIGQSESETVVTAIRHDAKSGQICTGLEEQK